MKSVLTLVASEGMDTTPIAAIANALMQAGGIIFEQCWLKQDYAHDIAFSGVEHSKAESIAAEILQDLPVDFLAQDTQYRRKKLLISDMDSTMITVECIDEIADFAGVKAKVALITERAMRGELDFIAALDERVGLLAGLDAMVLEQVYAERVTLMPGGRALVQTMRKFGAYTVLVSGGFDFFTRKVAQALGFHEDFANRLEILEQKLTGKVIPPILDKNAKLQTLFAVAQKLGITMHEVIAVGDGANDLPMLMASGLGVAYHAKRVVQESARARVNHGDLSALLYMQGYSEADIVI